MQERKHATVRTEPNHACALVVTGIYPLETKKETLLTSYLDNSRDTDDGAVFVGNYAPESVTIVMRAMKFANFQ